MKIHNVFHANLLSPVTPNPFPNRLLPTPPLSPDCTDENSPDIDRILSFRVARPGYIEFLVLWENSTREEATWEPLHVVSAFPDALLDFYRRIPEARAVTRPREGVMLETSSVSCLLLPQSKRLPNMAIA